MAVNAIEITENASRSVNSSLPVFEWIEALSGLVPEVESSTDGSTASQIDDGSEITPEAEHTTEYEGLVAPEIQKIIVDSTEAMPRGLARWIKSSRDVLKEAPTTLVLGAIDRLSQPKPKEEIPAPEKKTGRRRALKIGSGVVAIAIISGLAYANHKGLLPHTGGSSNAQEAAPTAPSQHHLKAAAEVLPGVSAPAKANPEHIHRLVHHASKLISKLRYHREHLNHSGDNVWSHSYADEHAKHPNLSSHRLSALANRLTKRILRRDHITDPNHLPEGFSFEVPN